MSILYLSYKGNNSITPDLLQPGYHIDLNTRCYSYN